MIIKNVNITLPGKGYALANGHPLYVQRSIPEPGDMHIYLEDNTTYTSGNVLLNYDKPFDMSYIVFKFNADLPNISDLFLQTYTTSWVDTAIFTRLRNRYFGTSFGGISTTTLVRNLVPVNGHTLDTFDGWTYFRDPAQSTGGVYKMLFDIDNSVVHYYKDNEYYGYGTVVGGNVNEIKYFVLYRENKYPTLYSIAVAGFMSFDEAASW